MNLATAYSRVLVSVALCPQIIKWLREFLAYGLQVVDVNGARSALANIISCVIQGNVVGLVLFVLYINDLTSAYPGLRDDAIC